MLTYSEVPSFRGIMDKSRYNQNKSISIKIINSLYGKVQAGYNLSENMPSARIKPVTLRTAVEYVDLSTSLAIQAPSYYFTTF